VNFLEMTAKAKKIILLIDKYDDIARQIISAMLFLFPAEIQPIIKKILSVETATLSCLIAAIVEAEKSQKAGAEKKEIAVKEIIAKSSVKDKEKAGSLIETGMEFIKLFKK
jgi:hypothetical protein